MTQKDVWTILYSGPEDGPKSTTSGRLSARAIGGRPQLAKALSRALEISSPDHVIVPLLEAEQPWWQAIAQAVPAGSRLCQPIDRGSGVGLLVALMRIRRQDPDASVVLLTSDDLCDDAPHLAKVALGHLDADPTTIRVVGRNPNPADGTPGPWLLPDNLGDNVACMVFDPCGDTRSYIVDQGAVKATPVVVGRVQALLAAYEHVRPDLVDQCVDILVEDRAHDVRALDELYPFVDAIDFYREVLALVPERLALDRHDLPAGTPTMWPEHQPFLVPAARRNLAS